MSMSIRLMSICMLSLSISSGASAQAPAPSVASLPVVDSVVVEIMVNKPIAEVWKRVGDFCDIRDWVPTDCEMLSGKENEPGAIRSTGREIIVGKTDYSYTYGQLGSETRPFRLYNGTLEAKLVSAKATKLLY